MANLEWAAIKLSIIYLRSVASISWSPMSAVEKSIPCSYKAMVAMCMPWVAIVRDVWALEIQKCDHVMCQHSSMDSQTLKKFRAVHLIHLLWAKMGRYMPGDRPSMELSASVQTPREAWIISLLLKRSHCQSSRTLGSKMLKLVVDTRSSWLFKIKFMGAEMQIRANWVLEIPKETESQSQLWLRMPCKVSISSRWPAANTTPYSSLKTPLRATEESFGPVGPTTTDKSAIIRIKICSVRLEWILAFLKTSLVRTVDHTNSSLFQLGMLALLWLKMVSCTFGVPASSESSNVLARSSCRTIFAYKVSMLEALSLW